jgi:hypothetical protein
MVDDGYVIAGSAATVRDRLAAIVKELRIGHLMLLCQFGNLSKPQTLKNIALYARDVMPHLRGLWSEWRDDWYPSVPGRDASAPSPARFAAAGA